MNYFMSVVEIDIDAEEQLSLTYSTAMACGRFKNLATYNLMHNALYQEAFHISSEFADTHRYVDSLNDDQEKGVLTIMSTAEKKRLRKLAIDEANMTGALAMDITDIEQAPSSVQMNYFIWKDIMDQSKALESVSSTPTSMKGRSPSASGRSPSTRSPPKVGAKNEEQNKGGLFF